MMTMSDDTKTLKDSDSIDGLTRLINHTEHLFRIGRIDDGQRALEQLEAGHPGDRRIASLKLKLKGQLPPVQKTASGSIVGLALLLQEVERLHATGRRAEAAALIDEIEKSHPDDERVRAVAARMSPQSKSGTDPA